jgi:hypothetical protein
MKKSMEGLYMPPFPVDRFVEAVRGVARRNRVPEAMLNSA